MATSTFGSTSREDSSQSTDIHFVSKNGACTVFHDHFEESIINFTGQHRCSISNDIEDIDDLIGKIVCSGGSYEDLNNDVELRISEAIPIVKVCSKANDKAVFGVISGQETSETDRSFSIGNMSFHLNKLYPTRKVMVNSVGEGSIWVCDANGSLENGDYITTSAIDGYGQRQDDDIRRNYTVAKITCDCTFDLTSDVYKCFQFVNNDGKIIKKAFVGCVYCC
jgi:hypothetical protein